MESLTLVHLDGGKDDVGSVVGVGVEGGQDVLAVLGLVLDQKVLVTRAKGGQVRFATFCGAYT